jgi:methylenetetrahydrofolate dehydrogenase (NADP+)/methenyltetrahydrofolate cyclohydrolase
MILDGRTIAQEIYADISARISQLWDKPKLGAILLGNSSESLRYIGQKRKFAQKIWMDFELSHFPENIGEEELLSHIQQLNQDKSISGYIVQLPLPDHIDSQKIIRAIDPKKDVDGFHPENQGKVLIWDASGFLPCTPAGVMKIFEHYNISLAGKRICILGQSNIAGKPMAQLCINAGATVTSCNSLTPDISVYTQHSDIIISATGVPHLITPEKLWKKTILIDIGFSVKNGEIFGDIDTLWALSAGHDVTPVPGWVGPMTVAMLLSNTLTAHEKRS